MQQQALYNMRWHDMISSILIVWKCLSLQVEIKYLRNTQRLTFIWSLSLLLQEKHSLGNLSHMFHSFKVHSHLVYCESKSLLCKPLEINGCGSDYKQGKQRGGSGFLFGWFCLFVCLLWEGFGDYKQEFQQNLGYDTMTSQEDLRKMDLHPLAVFFLLWTPGSSEILLWDIL